MEIKEQRHGAVTALRPDGPLTEDDATIFRQRVAAVRKESMGRFVVDLAETPFVDSKGLEALVEATYDLAESGQTLRLCGVNETVREALELTELAPLFEHYDDVNSAVRSFL